jgi:hypothetical protein
MSVPLPPGFGRPTIWELEGGYPPPPIPPGFVPSPSVAPDHIVQIMRATRGPWTEAGRYGQLFNNVLPAEDEIIGLLQTGLLPGEPGPVTVNFFRSNRGVQSEADPTRNAEIRGVVTYGCGGITNQFEVDMISGVQLTVVANHLTLDLHTYNPAPDSPYAPYQLIAAAVLGHGNASAALPPTFTTPFIASDGGSLGFTVDVPDFARSVCFHTNETDPTELAKLELEFVTPAVSIKVVNVAALYGELTREKGIAIPAGTNQITVTSTAVLTNPIRAGLQFFLAL